MVQTPDVHLEQQLWSSLFNWDTVLKTINHDKSGSKVCWNARGQHWTELPYLSLLPLDKRTPRAHTGHRDKIQQELPSAEPSWLIFLTTTRVKGYTGIFFKTAVCWRPFYIRVGAKWMSVRISINARSRLMGSLKPASVILDDELLKQMFATTCNKDRARGKDSPQKGFVSSEKWHFHKHGQTYFCLVFAVLYA